MGLLWIARKWEDEGRDNQTREETIDRYVLEMSDDNDGKKEVRDALSTRNGDVPPLAPYSPHPENDTYQRLYVSQLWLTRQPFSNRWEAEVTYSDEVDLPEDPHKQPMEWECDTEVAEEPSLLDVNGKPYQSTAGGWIEVTNDVPHVVLSGSRAIPPGFKNWLLQYGGAINADAITINGQTWPEKTLKVTRLKIGKVQTSALGDDYCDFNIELEYNANTWIYQTPNRDYFQLINIVQGRISNGKPMKPLWKRIKIKVKNEHGVLEEPHEPQLIDKNGTYIEQPTPSNVVILKFQRNRELPFSALPLK